MATDYANSEVQGYNPKPGPQNPGKYPFTGPAYAYYGEQPNHIYDPYSDYEGSTTAYKPDPTIQQNYYEASGLVEPKKDPSLTDQLLPVAGAAGAYAVGQGFAKDPSGYIGGIRDGLSNVYNAGADAVSGAYNYGSNAVSSGSNTASSAADSAGSTLSDGYNAVVDYFTGAPSTNVSTGASAAQNTGMLSSGGSTAAAGGDYGATQAALGMDYGSAAAGGTTTFGTQAAAEAAGYQVIGQNADGTVMATAAEGSTYGAAASALGAAAGVYALYNIGTADDKDDFGSTAQGAAAGAAIGSYILPGWGTAIGAVLGAAYGFGASTLDKDEWKQEKKRLEKLGKGDTFIPENLTASMPTHGRKTDSLVVEEVPEDFVGFANLGGQQVWVNNKFQSDRKVENLVAEDIVNYATFAEDDSQWFKRSLQERLNIANAALQAGAVKEHHGTIDVDFKKFDKTKAGQYNAIQGNPTALEIAGQMAQAPKPDAAAAVPNPQSAAPANNPAATQPPGTPRPNPGQPQAPSNTGMLAGAPKDNNVAPAANQPRAGHGVRQSPGIYLDPRSGKSFKSNTGMLSR